MRKELDRLELILKVNLLANENEELKIDLMNPRLKWHERIELYNTLQSINKRIDLINKRLQKRQSAS